MHRFQCIWGVAAYNRAMIHVLWEFHVLPGHEAEFESIYRPEGEWAELFRRDPGYHGTILLRDSQVSGRYITLDRWENIDIYRSFKQKCAADYRRLDEQCERLTDSEKMIGVFDAL